MVRYFIPKKMAGYRNYERTLDKAEVDIREEEGYYVDFEDGLVSINGQDLSSNYDELFHVTWTLFSAMGEPTEDRVYAISKQNRNAKWFSKAKESGQWINLAEYFKENINVVFDKTNEVELANAIEYFSSSLDIGIPFAEKILPLLSDKTGAMYKICSNISRKMLDNLELNRALKFFGLNQRLAGKNSINFSEFKQDIKSNYPLIAQLRNSYTIESQSKNESFSNELLTDIANYINAIDLKNRVENEKLVDTGTNTL